MKKTFNVDIDFREHSDRIEKAKTTYESEGDNVTVKELLVGDYVFDNQVCYEYKEFEDFISSVIDGRVFNQAVEMSSQFNHHFVVIRANDYRKHQYFDAVEDESHAFGWKHYQGAIARLNTITTVKECGTEKLAIEYMRTQAIKCLDNKRVVKHLKTKTENPAFNWLYGIHGIGDDTAELIVGSLDLYSLDDLMSLDCDTLQGIKGIGKEKSRIVMQSIKGKMI